MPLEEDGSMHMAQAARVWTVDDLQHLPDDGNRYEVIDGELLVTPAPTLDHQEAIARLHLMLAPYVGERGIRHVVFAPADVVFSARRGVRPDLFVVPLVEGRRPKQFGDVGRLLLAVEVLSPSTSSATLRMSVSVGHSPRTTSWPPRPSSSPPNSYSITGRATAE